MSRSSFITLQSPGLFVPLERRTGKLAFTLTNDYLFKVVLQRNEDILRTLLCSLLGLQPDSIRSVLITNAAEPGTTVHDKDAALDMRLILNHNKILNLEMQIRNEHNWPERSLTYLCRSFDNVPKGADYKTAFPTHHIGILCFSPAGMPKQFYSHYYMMEQHSHSIYTPKFRLSILDLTQAGLATDADRQQGLDLWAAAFRATTWEEFQMLAEKDTLFKTVSDALYIVLENKDLADQIRRQWEYEAIEKRRKELAQRRDALMQRREKRIQKREAECQQREAAQQQREAAQQQREAEQQQREATQQQREAEQQQREAEQQQREAEFQQREAECQQRENQIQQYEVELQQRAAALEAKSNALKASLE